MRRIVAQRPVASPEPVVVVVPISRERQAPAPTPVGRVSKKPKGGQSGKRAATTAREQDLVQHADAIIRAVDGGGSIAEIAKHYRVPRAVMADFLKRYGYVFNRPVAPDDVKSWIKMHLRQNLSTPEIARRTGRSLRTIADHLREAGVLRTIAEAVLIAKRKRSGRRRIGKGTR